ncbi:MAG: VWA domain-containing protein [Candidatus Lokiarchaeota archaeon]|nr:VWA domain-containing protein [Candidatus Lokiarchaeota archaeon]
MEDLGPKPNDTQIVKDKFRLSGNIPTEMILEAEIQHGGNVDRFEKLLKEANINSDELRRLSDVAIKYKNASALEGFARVNRLVVARSLQTEDGVKLLDRRPTDEQSNAPEIYFLIKNELNSSYKKIFRRLARSAILKLSLRIASKWIKGEKPRKVPYEQGLEFDLEETLENYLEKGSNITYDDIVGIYREKKRKAGLVIIDTSGSMHNEKIINAALTASVLAYSMRDDDYGIITFNTQAQVLTSFDDNKNNEQIIDEILESEPAGYTNITTALKLGLEELLKIKKREKWTILITDGNYNRGGDPREWASKYPKLHVISIPSRSEKWGLKICNDLAKRGRGRFVKVSRYSEIPRVLARMLRDI